MNKWGIDIFVFGGENAFSPTPVNPVICGLYCLIFIFSTMFKIHINGRSSSHNSSQELDELGTSYDTSSSLMVTGRSTIAIITYKYHVFRIFILWNCFTYYLWLVCFGHYDCNQRGQIMKAQESHFFTIVDLNVHRCLIFLSLTLGWHLLTPSWQIDVMFNT